MARAADGHREFETFAARSSTGLLRAAYLLCGDRQAAEDLVQTALMRTARRWRVRGRVRGVRTTSFPLGPTDPSAQMSTKPGAPHLRETSNLVRGTVAVAVGFVCRS